MNPDYKMLVKIIMNRLMFVHKSVHQGHKDVLEVIETKGGVIMDLMRSNLCSLREILVI